MKQNKIYKLIKDNLNLIILIPTILGGFWQLFELVSIDASFLRFFSVTQVISDGLIILYFIIVLFMSYKFAIYMSTKSKKEIETVKLVKYIRFFLTLLLIIIILYEFSKNQKITVLGLSFFILLIIVFGNMLLDLMGKELVLKILEAKWSKDIALVIFLGLFLLLIISLDNIFNKFHNSWFIPEKLKNTEYIECLLKKNASEFEILYFNDKYIFIEIKNKTKSREVEIIKFEEFFNNKNCN